MFMEPFTGLLSGPLNQLAFGSAQGSADVAMSVGVPEDTAYTIGGYGMMPGWLIAAMAHMIGS